MTSVLSVVNHSHKVAEAMIIADRQKILNHYLWPGTNTTAGSLTVRQTATAPPEQTLQNSTNNAAGTREFSSPCSFPGR